MDIVFVSNEMAGFFGYMLQNAAFKPLQVGNQDVAFFDFLGKMQDELCKGKIRNIDDWNNLTRKEFPDRKNGVETFCQKSIEEEKKYSAFYHENIDAIEKYKKAIDITYDDERRGYKKDLVKLYNFFDVEKDFNCYALLTPVPEKKYDGQTIRSVFSINYETHQSEPAENYFDNSVFLKRKISTPFHEASHVLFGRSKIKKDLKEGIEKGAKRLLSAMDQYFNKNPTGVRNEQWSVKKNSIEAVDEALAACASIVVDNKYVPKKETDEFYYGFEGADALAKNLWPVFCDYMQSGKKMDDNFYMTVAKNFEKQENLSMEHGLKEAIEDSAVKPTNKTLQETKADENSSGSKKNVNLANLANQIRTH